MPELERAKLIPVDGPNDQPDTGEAVDVQFNPATLKVALSNTLKANEREGSSRAAQFVDKSSSNLTIDLVFDTSKEATDVREKTKEIALKFLKPVGEGENMQAPKRCLFQWGAFEFVGLISTFNETLDFFSPEGLPLRAAVGLKLSEDRFQFRSRAVAAAERETPTLTPTGAAADAGANSAAGTAGGGPGKGVLSVTAAVGIAGGAQADWRQTALFNGIENPRLPGPGTPLLAVPKAGASRQTAASMSIGAHLSAGVSAPQPGVVTAQAPGVNVSVGFD